jgi:hypothetical protein
MAKDDTRVDTPPSRRALSPSLIGLVIVAAVAITFFWQNSGPTTIELLGFTWDTTIRWSLTVAALLGAALDRLVSIWSRRRRRKRIGTGT